MLLLAVSLPLAFLMPAVQATQATPSQQDKAISFLRDVIQLDLAKYKVTLNDQYTNVYGDQVHLFYNLDSASSSIFSSLYRAIAIFNFYNGTLGSCDLSPGSAGLLYVHPTSNGFNFTLGIVERYQAWADDSQAQEMVNLLRDVGSQRNATENSGNLSLKISVGYPLTEYKFSNTLNGVDYTGLTLYFGNGSGDLFFENTRASLTIGDTSINVSKEQALSIGENYVKNYSYNATLGNMTKITVSNLNVTGVYSVYLDSAVRNDSTLYPYWTVMFNVSNLPSPGLQGIIVKIWADDGSLSSIQPFSTINIAPLLDTLLFFPMYSSIITGLELSGIFSAAVVIVLVLVLRRSNKNSTTE